LSRRSIAAIIIDDDCPWGSAGLCNCRGACGTGAIAYRGDIASRQPDNDRASGRVCLRDCLCSGNGSRCGELCTGDIVGAFLNDNGPGIVVSLCDSGSRSDRATKNSACDESALALNHNSSGESVSLGDCTSCINRAREDGSCDVTGWKLHDNRALSVSRLRNCPRRGDRTTSTVLRAGGIGSSLIDDYGPGCRIALGDCPRRCD